METVSVGISFIPPAASSRCRQHFPSRFSISASPGFSASCKVGLPKASQAAELFPSSSSGIVIREARVDDYWEVAETHCSSFFPSYSFPLDVMLRINRAASLLSGFSVPEGCKRTCLVAAIGGSTFEFFGSEGFKNLRFGEGDCKRSIAGILTVDTLGDFLPRKGPQRQRRRGIAYVSNVAVRQGERRKGIASRLMVQAEALARSWGCHAIALHCEEINRAAMKLYLRHGFRCIKIPEGARWPLPRTSPNVQFNFMMKTLPAISRQQMTS